MPRVSIHITTWNSLRFLPQALQSIYDQTERDFQVIVVDNASTDKVADFLRANFPSVVLLRNFKNLGFARAHNQAIELAKSLWQKQGEGMGGKYVLVTNPDIVLAPDCLEKMLAAAATYPEVGSVGPKLYKIYEAADGEFNEQVRTNVIDSTGMKLLRTGRLVERGAGEEDKGQYDRLLEVFGISGALCLYPLTALEAARQGEEYFDEKFFSYKEDADLAWRLRLAGLGSRFEPTAIAYHYRGAYGSEKRSLIQAWRERRAKSEFVNRLSYRNHFWLLVKNLDFSTFLRYGYALLPYEALKLAYLLVFERGTLGALFEALAGFGEMRRRRKLNSKNRRASAREIRKWFE